MTGDGDTVDHEAFEARCRVGIEAWVADNLGAEVVEMKRLERWRPQWKVTYTAGGETGAVLVRGNRPIAPVEALRFEMECMEVLEANGILVPHIHGWMDDPVAFVMDWVETKDRAPGMLHTAMDNPSEMDDDRWQAMLGYMSHLVAVHAVPVSEFAHIRRLAEPPTDPREIALHAVDRMYAMGEMAGNIDPSLSFLQRWLRHNAPTDRHDVHFLCGDAGQFMSRGPDVIALLDFEIANVGDTHWDLACFRGRHPYENMGDIPALYREYERVTGQPVDRRIVGYYTVAFLQLAVIGATFFMIPEIRGGNWIEGMLEKASITRRAYEAIAELQGLELDHDLTLPPRPRTASRPRACGSSSRTSSGSRRRARSPIGNATCSARSPTSSSTTPAIAAGSSGCRARTSSPCWTNGSTTLPPPTPPSSSESMSTTRPTTRRSSA